MAKSMVFYLKDSKSYRALRYIEKVSIVEEWLKYMRINIISDDTCKNNKYKLVYLVDLDETLSKNEKFINSFYQLPNVNKCILSVDMYN